jgi:YVTN family beta-propeller protein
MRHNNRLIYIIIAASMAIYGACAASDEASDANGNISTNNTGGPSYPGDNNNNNNNNGGYVPEPERDYTFSQPAVFGRTLFVANETLNSVVWIDSETLTIRTIPVGLMPTKIVGPSIISLGDSARIYVLNEGNASVSVIEPTRRTVLKTVPVLSGANALLAAPDGKSALAWYDNTAGLGLRLGDLSSVTVLRGEAAYQVAVGFHVRRVQITADSARALVLTDDGVSVIELADVDSDRLAPPVPLVPRDLRELSPRDLEVQISRDGRWALTRTTAFAGLVLLDLMTRVHTLVRLPETPTDLDLAERGAGDMEALVMLRQRGELVRITIPAGFEALAAAQIPLVMNMDLDMSDDVSPGIGSDTGPDMELDMSAQDMDATGMSNGEDMAPPVELPQVAGVRRVELPAALGLAAVSGNGAQALLYSTLNGQQLVELVDLVANTQRSLLLEKGVLGVVPDESGQTFLIFHSREPGELPAEATPSDPEFVARSWGVSAVDVASAINRLVLTELEPAGATLWREQGADARAYLIFRAPEIAALVTPAHRDVVEINMATFGIDSLRVPSLPKAIGPVPGTGRIYISQEHPRGRMTFLDVISRARQTVTGYQLNAGID